MTIPVTPSKRGRGRPPALTADQAAEVRRLYSTREATYEQLRKTFGVGLATLHRAIHINPTTHKGERK